MTPRSRTASSAEAQKRCDDHTLAKRLAPLHLHIWLVPHPGTDDRVKDVDDQIHDHVNDGDHEDESLDRHVVAARYPIPGVQSDARPGEYRLDDDVSGHQIAENDSHDGEQRYHGVLQGILPDDPPLRQPKAVVGLDEVGIQYRAHRSPGHLDERGHDDKAEDQHRQRQVPRRRCESAPMESQHAVDGVETGDRGRGLDTRAQPPNRLRGDAQLHVEDENEDDTKPEDRRRSAQNGDLLGNPVDPPPSVHCRHGTDRYAEEEGYQQAVQAQFNRRGQPLQQVLQDRVAGL